jgi:flagellar basal-body rod protein FlgG
MNNAFYIAATGMQAQQLGLDTVANNLANMNTVGFKRSLVSFSDLVQASVTDANGIDPAGVAAGAPWRMGSGVAIAGIARQFDTGDLKKTGAPLDVAIQGEGFLEVAMPDGTRAFTRGGTLKVGLDGQLATQAGLPLKPGIAIPSGAQNLVIQTDGRVQITVAGQAAPIEVGQLALVRFADPTRLAVAGSNLYRASDDSGEPINGKASEDGMGSIAQGVLESSNVKMVDEMVGLMITQRAYEASLKLVQAADEMSGMVNNLRK